ncbi:MAG: hypothetical protein JJU29_22815 [Verrucomicrobia bacterium]|nr:hypothetical protein [Verrucomicrobiota bacterium]MCH8510832.1 hypothetical protein [Kiritimatiellia bacterium]
MTFLPLLDDAFLASHWHAEYEAFTASTEAKALHEHLKSWAAREVLKETASETAFIQRFFVETWGYSLQGKDAGGQYTCRPQFEVERAGQSGGQGRADLALGHFGTEADGVPQVLCEFKDIRSGLEARQNRKGNARSPVDQAFDYLQEAHASRDRDALVTPSWALVTDMREFRLYSRLQGKARNRPQTGSGPRSAPKPSSSIILNSPRDSTKPKSKPGPRPATKTSSPNNSTPSTCSCNQAPPSA